MTPDQMAELAARLRAEADSIRSATATIHDIKHAADLERAADLIESMAQRAEPVATVHYPRTGGNAGLSWTAIPETGVMPQDGAKLYLAPQSQRVPLSDEQIRALVQPMDWPPSVTEIVRAVEQAHGIRGEK